jgi:hypothetical protein
MEGEMDKGRKEEAMDPIMIEEDQIKQIMATAGKTRSGVPYQYKMNNKKRSIANRDFFASDEEEVEDLQAMEQIEEILCTTYERNIRGPRKGIEGRTPIHFNVSVEPITPCVTSMPKRTPPFRQPNFSGRKTTGNSSKKGAAIGRASSRSINQISTPHGGSGSSQLKMAGHDPTIRLPEFQGDESDDPEKHLFICEKIWEAKHITDEDTKLAQLAIMLRGHTLDWYMSLVVNSPP